jgi:diguanylate cyclase (GGDEF)-like protein
VGDEVLISVASRVRALREHDLVARLGGDEFAVLLTPLQSRRRRAHRREDHRQHEAADPAGHGTRITTSLSVGIAYYPDDGATRPVCSMPPMRRCTRPSASAVAIGKWRRRNAAPRM